MTDDGKKDGADTQAAHCQHCRGSGVVSYGCGAIPCAACGGRGVVPETDEPAGPKEKAKEEER